MLEKIENVLFSGLESLRSEAFLGQLLQFCHPERTGTERKYQSAWRVRGRIRGDQRLAELFQIRKICLCRFDLRDRKRLLLLVEDMLDPRSLPCGKDRCIINESRTQVCALRPSWSHQVRRRALRLEILDVQHLYTSGI